MPESKKFALSAATIGIAVLLTVVLAETGLRLLHHYEVVRMPTPPDAGEDYWDSQNDSLGVWRKPGSETQHTAPCFDVQYRTNSVGARDREREVKADGPRAIVLGDSFIEGWGLPEQQRLSNLLEQKSGIEHLNFGMSHFSPYQSYLAYKEIAKAFDHDRVVLGVLPGNDFNDLDYEAARDAAWYAYRYRPYLVGNYPFVRQLDLRESPLHRLLRRNFYLFHAGNLLLNPPRAGKGYLAPAKNELGRTFSFFHDYNDRQFALLRRSIELLADEAKGRPVIVVMIPLSGDLARFGETGGSLLKRRLERAVRRPNVRVIDLSEPMYVASNGRVGAFFFSCDYHWNARGNAVAAEIISAELAEDFPAYGSKTSAGR